MRREQQCPQCQPGPPTGCAPAPRVGLTGTRSGDTAPQAPSHGDRERVAAAAVAQRQQASSPRRAEVEEVEALARCCEEGLHRQPRQILDAGEIEARRQEDHQDADACRLLFYTGVRVGELLTLRWDDVDLKRRILFVRRGLSAGEEGLPKGGRPRFVPMSTPAMDALQRLASRADFVRLTDYVLVNRFGRRLDPSALRRRYKRGCAAAGLRPVRLHGLRHAAGSLVARTSDAVFVRDFLGHSKLSITDRYVSAKARPEELERLDRAFASANARHEERSRA